MHFVGTGHTLLEGWSYSTSEKLFPSLCKPAAYNTSCCKVVCRKAALLVRKSRSRLLQVKCGETGQASSISFGSPSCSSPPRPGPEIEWLPKAQALAPSPLILTHLYSEAVSWARVECRSWELGVASEPRTAHSDSPFHAGQFRCPNVEDGKSNGHTST